MAQIVIHVSEHFLAQIQKRLQELGQPQQQYVAGLIARELLECGQITREDAERFSILRKEIDNLVVRLPVELYNAMVEQLEPKQTIQNYLLGLIEADVPRIKEGVPLEICQEDLHPSGEIKRAKVYFPIQLSDTLRAYWENRTTNRSAHIITLIRQDLALRQDMALKQELDAAESQEQGMCMSL